MDISFESEETYASAKNLKISQKRKLVTLYIYVSLVYTTLMMNFDTGIFPPILDKIKLDLNISE